jgi:hypothetical protein
MQQLRHGLAWTEVREWQRREEKLASLWNVRARNAVKRGKRCKIGGKYRLKKGKNVGNDYKQM